MFFLSTTKRPTDTGNKKEEEDMLPEVENYITVLRTSHEEYDKEHREIRYEVKDEYDGESLYYYDRSLFNQKYRALDEQRSNKINEAWGALKTSENRLVRFIAENCESYRSDHAKQVLMLLPCSTATITQYAKERGWCDQFDDFVADAADAGLIDGISYTREQIALRKYLRSEWSVSSDQMEKIQELSDAITAAEIAKAAKS